MRTILYIVQKEFLQIMRNKTMIPMIFALPFIQLIILVNAATLDMKNIELIIVDKDLSSNSASLAGKFSISPFFKIVEQTFSTETAEKEMLLNNTDMILVIPEGFEEEIYKRGDPDLQIQIDAINGMTASLSQGYALQIINTFYTER